jgi:hypothetical protein
MALPPSEVPGMRVQEYNWYVSDHQWSQWLGFVTIFTFHMSFVNNGELLLLLDSLIS